MTTRLLLRPPGFDDLGVRRALSDRLLPLLVAAMAFLAALALAGAVGAAGLAQRWQQGAGGTVTVQVPQPGEPATPPGGTRLDRVRAELNGTGGIGGVRVLGDEELRALLRPWLGTGAAEIAIPLPAVLDVRLGQGAPDQAVLAATLERIAPGTLLEEHDRWVGRLATLARSLQACAAVALLVVAFVAAAVIAVATRAGLALRRDAIETVYGLGATDRFIAGRFARRATVLAGSGAAVGTAAALPVLAGLTGLAAPFGDGAFSGGVGEALRAVPAALWLAVACLPPLAGALGWITAQRTVRRWLRRLP